MSGSWSWNILSPPHTLVLWSSGFYSRLWVLMKTWLKGTEQLKKIIVLWKQQISCFGSPHSPIPICLPGVSRRWYPPPFPIGDWSACPILSVLISKWTQARFQAQVSYYCREEAASPWYGPWHMGMDALACPLLASWGPFRYPHTQNGHGSLNAHGWVMCCCPPGQHKELEHPTWILIQIRDLVVTRAFFSFKNIKFELKIFR